MEFDYSCQPGRKDWNLGYVKTEKPLLSIITPFYNDSGFIMQTARCVFNQTFPYFEWVIVNDGSTEPKALETLEEIEQSDPRVRVLHQENGGPAAARNYGAWHSQTDFILPLDADDLIEPPFLEYCWWMLQKNPGAAWDYTGSLGFGSIEYLWDQPFDPIRLKRENHLTITALIRKKEFLALGGYEERRNYNEDWQLWLKLTARGCYPAQSGGEYLFWYRRSDSGELSTVRDKGSNEKRNRELIAQAAAQVKNPPVPVIYPQMGSFDWSMPRLSSWKGHVHADKKKIHVLFLFPHMVMGGADKFNLDLISGLNSEKFETGIITMNPSSNDWLQRFREATPNIFNLPNFMSSEDYAEFISYYIKSRQVDILFLSNAYHGYALVPWLREQFPKLAIVDYVHMEEWYWRAGGYARTSGVIGGITEKTYVCNSATKDVLVSSFGRKPDSVETVHIGVDEAYFSAEKTQPGKLYQEMGISQDRLVVLFICRMNPQKRPFLMLEIAKRVAACVPQVAFAVVGDGPQLQELMDKTSAMGLKGTVYFLGAGDDVRCCYRDARLTLICSLKEGLSLTAYESCSMGVPVVSADVGGQKDLIDDSVGALIPCGQTEADSLDARSFPEDEIQAYVDAICGLLTDSARWTAASKACRGRILNGFTIQNMVDHFEKEFCRLTEDAQVIQQRQRVSDALNLCAPIASEVFTLEMQMQKLEDGYQQQSIRNGNKLHSLLEKARLALKEEGVQSFLKRTIRWFRKRMAK